MMMKRSNFLASEALIGVILCFLHPAIAQPTTHPAPPFVAGRVVSDDGKPLANARVLVYDMYLSLNDNTPPFSTATTDAEGLFKLSCPSVTFTLFIEAAGYGLFSATPPPTVGNEQLKITMEPATSIRFKAVGLDGLPKAGMRVSPYSITTDKGTTYLLEPFSQKLSQTTDENGICVFPDMPRESSIVFDYPGFGQGGSLIDTGDKGSIDVDPVSIQPGATVEVRVIRADTGQPMPNLRVGAGITDAQGRFRLVGITAGERTFSANLISPLSGLFFAAPVKLTLSGTQEVQNVEIKLLKGMLIHGKVSNSETGAPIQYAQVSLLRRPDGITPASVRSGPDGTYALQLPPGQYTLFIHEVLRSGFQRQDDNLPIVTLDDAHPEATVDFQCKPEPNAAVKGRVVDDQGNPVAGAEVVATPDGSVTDLGGQPNFNKPMVREMAGGSATTDADGRFVIPFVGDRARLTVVKGYSRLTNPIIIGPASRDLDLRLPKISIGTILVRTGDDHGNPLGGVKIVLSWRDGLSQHQKTAVTEDDGTYRFGPLFEGMRYMVEASRKGYTQEYRNDLNIQVAEEKTVRLDLSRADSFIAGTVVDQNRRPIAGAIVRTLISREPTYTYLTARTDAKGHFRIDGLVAGTNVTLYTRVAPYTDGESTSQALMAGAEDAVVVYQQPR